jgi:predicted O-linked N-acetylglucosamine transferase (SPINDLY family)
VLEASLIQELSFNDDELLRQNVTKWAASKRRSSGFDNLKLGSAKPSNKIKVGFLTGDARLHSVGKLLKPFIEFLIQEDDIEVFVYNNMENPFADPINQWFKDNTNYRYINGRSDFDVARDIRMDGINVLFDCSSHTDNNRLEVLLYKPAPCIVSYLAFPFTTGLPEVDYIVTDWACKRAEWWPEKALEMPSICYVEMEKSEALRLPFLESGIFTFGSLAPPYKITPETLDLWAAVLRANPKAQFYYARPELRHRTIQTNFLNEMLMRGVDSSRIRLETNEGQKHWHHYTKIDVILDTLWLTGGLSTIDACRMGVPTLSVQGPNYWNNLSMSLQHNLFKAHGGHKDKEHLIENATQLATDIDYYIKVRKIFNESNEAEEGREAWKQDMLKFLRSQSSLNS